MFEIQRASATAAFEHIFPPDQFPFPDEGERKRWREYLQPGASEVLVAEREGHILGMVVLTRDVMERLFVHPDYWRQGVGSRLHDEAIQRCLDNGFDSCRLYVLEDNRTARRFYERKGWEMDGRRMESMFPPFPVGIGYTLRELAINATDHSLPS
ncbi:MAG: GNAT family N-acetyltransferase [Actinobacteria bacterium]|nr:GNAT family N-acetyltransferase [Actinomycetota bacterium]